MHQQRFYSLEEVRYLSRRKVILPGDVEPEWLRRNAALSARLAELKRDGASVEPPSRLFRRLAFVFGR